MEQMVNWEGCRSRCRHKRAGEDFRADHTLMKDNLFLPSHWESFYQYLEFKLQKEMEKKCWTTYSVLYNPL